jgi:hypothetical protein
MKLSEAIERLQAQLKRHGDVELYFDCPKCLQAFTPNSLVAEAVHLTQVPEPK